MNLRNLLTACAVASLFACAGEPTVQTGEDAETIMGTLNRVDNSRADLVYVDPSVDFGRYERIRLLPLGVDNVEIIQPPGSSISTRINRDWELTDADKARLQREFAEAMERELTRKNGYALTDETADDVLVVESMITQLAPTAPKDANRTAGRGEVYTEGAGAISIAVVLADAESGEVLALIKDRYATQNNWGVNNSVTNLADVRRAFSRWAGQMRTALDRVHGK
jgi:hypothetical protein